MILEHILTHGLFYAVVATVYLFLVMILFSPRIWGYNDYPDVVKKIETIMLDARTRPRIDRFAFGTYKEYH